MASKIFVNLPVKDLQRSKDFFGQLGYTFNEQFTDENAASMVISDDIYAMLLVEPYFKTFIKKEIADATKSTEVLLALSLDSKDEVDSMMTKGLGAGGKEARDVQDLGFMYGRALEDPDGHIWEFFWMDPSAVEPS